MTRSFLLILLALIVSISAWGAPICPAGATLAYYIGVVGAGGCQIGNLRFYSFSYTGTIATGQIAVLPDTTPGMPGLTFLAGWSAGSGQTSNSTIAYSVEVVGGSQVISGMNASMEGYAATADGEVSVRETAVFPSFTLILALSHSTAITQPSNGINFSPVLSVPITNDISATGNTGSASVTTVKNSFALTPIAPPILIKAFDAVAIPVGGATTLKVTAFNTNPVTLTGVSFTDALPAGLTPQFTVSNLPYCNGTFTITATSITVDNWAIPAGADCSVTSVVTGTTPGTKVNTTSSVTSNEGGTGDPASANVNVFGPAAITKSFGAVAIPVGGMTTVSFTLSNPAANPAPLTGIQFLDTLPAGLLVANPNGLTGSCAPIATITATPGGNSVGLGNLALNPGDSCSFSVNVAGMAEGMQTNTAGAVGSNEGGAGPAATAAIFVGPAFQVTYAANLTFGESYLDISNNGANGAPLLGPGFGDPVGNICVNAYAFSPDEQMISCCSCLVTPNGLANIGVARDLTSKTLTGVIPTSVVVKLVTTLAGERGTGRSCANSAASVSPEILAGGLAGWRTTLHEAPIPPGGYSVTETPFSQGILSAAELASLRGRCASILGNGSGFGICRSCQAGALGADRM